MERVLAFYCPPLLTGMLPPLPCQSLLSRFVDGMTFKVNFTFNRQPLRVQHRALELTGRWPLGPMLFPVPLVESRCCPRM